MSLRTEEILLRREFCPYLVGFGFNIFIGMASVINGFFGHQGAAEVADLVITFVFLLETISQPYPITKLSFKFIFLGVFDFG